MSARDRNVSADDFTGGLFGEGEGNVVALDGTSADDLHADAEELLAKLDENLDDDAGYIGKAEVLDLLVRLKLRDSENWARVEAVLRRRKILRTTLEAVKRLIRARNPWERAAGNVQALRRLVSDVMPGAPGAGDAIVPPQWEILTEPPASGEHTIRRFIERRKGDEVEIVRVPVEHGHLMIASQRVDAWSGEAFLEIAWRPTGGEWRSTIVARAKLGTTAAAAPVLCAHDAFPMSPDSARDILTYLRDYEATNAVSIDRRMVSQQSGWHGDEHRGGFLAGPSWLKCSEESPNIEFLGADDGDRQLGESLGGTAGTLEEWLEAVEPVSRHPRCELGLYAALAAPVLKIIGAPNFIVEWCGQTSSGKTTTLMLAASVWGDPDGRGASSFIGSWASTKVAIERRMAALSDLPVILDDTKLARVFARGETIIPGVVYAAVNGQSDARGSVDGLQRGRRWRTVLLSTGEERLVDKSKAGGTVARVLTLWGSPFVGDARADVEALRTGVLRHYGHAGTTFVRWLIANKGEWEIWREQWRALQAEFAPIVGEAGNDAGVTGRIATYLAVLELTSRLAHRALAFPWALRSPVRAVVADVGRESRTARRDQEALGMLASHIAQNMAKIQNGPEESETEPQGGWLGFMPDSTVSKPWEFLAIYPGALRGLLAREGYDVNAILRQWNEAGKLRALKDRNTNWVFPNGQRVQMVCITREALVDAGFGSIERPELPL